MSGYTLFVDADTLAKLGKAGELGLLKVLGADVVVTSVVGGELSEGSGYPGSAAAWTWLRQNEGQPWLNFSSQDSLNSAGTTGSDAGEQSIVTAANSLISSGSSTSVIVVTDNSKDFSGILNGLGSNSGDVNVNLTQSFISNLVFYYGVLSPSDYLQVQQNIAATGASLANPTLGMTPILNFTPNDNPDVQSWNSFTVNGVGIAYQLTSNGTFNVEAVTKVGGVVTGTGPVSSLSLQDRVAFDNGSLIINGTLPKLDTKCFASGTRIATFLGGVKCIEEIKVGDVVVAFSYIEKVRKIVVAYKKVVRLLPNVTSEWLCLSVGLTVTPGHMFLNEHGVYERIDNIVERGGKIVSETGCQVCITAERVVYSEATKHLYEEVEDVVIANWGNAALTPEIRRGWRTYNFEVEDYHTYIAEGYLVHNDSYGDVLSMEEQFADLYGHDFDPTDPNDIAQLNAGVSSGQIDPGSLASSIGPNGDLTQFDQRVISDEVAIETKVTNANGTTSYTDAQGDIYTLDANGDLAQEANPNTLGGYDTSTFGYTATGQQYVSKEIDTDNSGQIRSTIANTVDPNTGALQSSTEKDYDASGSLQDIFVSNAAGQDVSWDSYKSDGSHTLTMYNAAGDATADTQYASDGVTVVSQQAFGYDTNGNLASIQTLDGSGNLVSFAAYNPDGSYTLSNFNSAGDRTDAIQYATDGVTVLSTQQFSYDSSGDLSSVNTLNGQGVLVSTLSYNSDGSQSLAQFNNGQLSTITVTDPYGATVSLDTYAANGSHVLQDYNSAGQVTEQTSFATDGATVLSVKDLTYDSAGALAQIQTYDGAGNPVSTDVYQPDGSHALSTYAADGTTTVQSYNSSGKLVMTESFDVDDNLISGNGIGQDGTPWTETVDASGNVSFNYGSTPVDYSSLAGGAANAFGSALGQALGGNNLGLQIAYGTILGALSQDLATELISGTLPVVASASDAFGGVIGGALDAAMGDAFGSFGVTISQQFQSITVGDISGVLMAELATSLHLSGFEAREFTAIGGVVTKEFITDALKAVTAGDSSTGSFVDSMFANFNPDTFFTNIETAGMGALGGYLGSLVVQPENEDGAIGGSVGSAVASFIAVALLGPLAPLGALLSSFLGDIVGTLIGDLFEGEPEASADVTLNGSGGVNTSNVWTKNDGNSQLVSSLADATSSSINGLLTQANAKISGLNGALTNFDQKKSTVTITNAFGVAQQADSSSASSVWTGFIDSTALAYLRQAVETSSDIVMIDALGEALLREESVADASADLVVAQNYEFYLANKDIIDAVIAANPKSSFAAGWEVTLLKAETLGLEHVSPSDGASASLAGNVETIYDAQGVVVEKILFNQDETQTVEKIPVTIIDSNSAQLSLSPDTAYKIVGGDNAIVLGAGDQVFVASPATASSSGEPAASLAPGDDTFAYASGDGAVGIESPNGGTINFGAGITAPDLSYTTDASGDLKISIGKGGDSITILNELANETQAQLRTLPMVTFSDGTPLTLEQAVQVGANLSTVTGDTVMIAGPSSTTVSLNNEANASALDVTVYSSSNGNLVINGSAASQGNDLIQFSDLNASDLTFTRNNDDWLITVNKTGNTISVPGEFAYGNNGIINGVKFADASQWAWADLYRLTNDINATQSIRVDTDFGGGQVDFNAVSVASGVSLNIGGATTGTIANTGEVSLASGSTLLVGVDSNSTISLSGGGKVALDTGGQDRIYSNYSGVTLHNVDNTISGTGAIYGFTLQNNGLIEATASAGLYLSGLALQQTDAGVLEANGGNVYLQNITITGGLLTTAQKSVIEVYGGGTVFDDTQAANPLTITASSTVEIGNYLNLQLDGASAAAGDLVNEGTVSFGSTGDWTDLQVGSGDNGTVSLTGWGRVALDASGRDRIYSNFSGFTLDNVDNTISGSGAIYGLILQNQGLIEATAPAGLSLSSLILEDTGGGLLEANGGNVLLHNMTVEGGPLTTIKGSVIETSGGGTVFDDTLSAIPLTITTGSTVEIGDYTDLQLDGTSTAAGDLVNEGAISFGSTGDYTDLQIGSGDDGTVSLTGGGVVALDATGRDRIYSSYDGVTLVNVNNTIEGAGNIYNLTLQNQSLIESTDPSGLYLYDMTLQDTGAGLLEADGGNVYLQSMTIDGGALTTANGSVIETHNSGTVFDDTIASDPLTITTGSTVEIGDYTNLQLDGSVGAAGDLVNKGELSFGSTSDWTDLQIGSGDNGTVSLTGGGVVALDGSGRDRIYSSYNGVTLVNVNNTIEGAGNIYGLTLENQSLIEATDPSGLHLYNMTLQDTGAGVLEANGGNVYLRSMTVEGGPLTSLNGGLIETDSSGTVFDDTIASDPLTITTGSTVEIGDYTDLLLDGTSTAAGNLVNEGALSFGSTSDYTDLHIGSGDDGTVSLTGGGVVALDATARDRIYSSYDGVTLVNVNNTIEGAGNIYNLTLQNQSLIESTDPSGLYLYDMTLQDTGAGLLEANGGNVYLQSMTIDGGALTTTDGSVIETYSSGTVFDDTIASDPLTITTGSTVEIGNYTNLQLDGSAGAAGNLVNEGTVFFGSKGDWTDLQIGSGDNGTVSLTGGGVVALDGSGRDRIYSSYNGVTLVNVNNTIEGAGNIYNLTLQNQSLIESTDPSGLYLYDMTLQDTGAGLLEADGGDVYLQGMTIDGGALTTANGSVIETYSSGTVFDDTIASDPLTITTGSTVEIGNYTNLQLDGSAGAAGDLVNEGTVSFGSKGDWTDLQIGSGDNGTVSLTGGGVVALDGSGRDRIYSSYNGVTLVNVNNTIAGAGALSNLTMTNQAGGAIIATVGTQSLTIENSVTLVNNGSIEADGGELLTQTIVSGSGSATILNDGALDAEAAFNQNVAFEGSGQLILAQAYSNVVNGFAGGDLVGFEFLRYSASDRLIAGQTSNGATQWSIEDAAGDLLTSIWLEIDPAAPGVLTLTQDAAGDEALLLSAVTVSVFLSDQADLDQLPDGFSVVDTAAHVSQALSSLSSDAHINAITLTGAPTLTLSVAQFVSGTAALTRITNADVVLALTDTASDVAANLDALNADSRVGTITLTDSGVPVLDLTAAQLGADQAILAKITNALFEVVGPSGETYYYRGGTAASSLSSTLAGADIVVAANSYLTLWGSNDTIASLGGNTLAPIGDNETISATTGDTIWLGAVYGDTITGADFTVHVTSGTNITIGDNGGDALDVVAGSGATVAVQAGAQAEFWGDGYQITLGANATLAPIGNNDTISATTGDTLWLGPVTGDTITGGNFTVHVTSGTNITIGDNGTGALDTVAGGGATVAVEAGAQAEFWGDGYQITLGANATLAPIGNNDTISATTGDTLWLGPVSGDTITGANFTVHVASGADITIGDNGTGALDTVAGGDATVAVQAGAQALFWGDDYEIKLGVNATLAAIGNNETIAATTGDAIWLGAVTGDTITGAGFTVNAASGAAISFGGNGASGAVDTVAGAGLAWTLLSGSNAAFWGGGDQITSQGASDYAIYGANDTIAAGAADAITIAGSKDAVTAASNDAIIDYGSGLTLDVSSGIGSLTLSDFGSDASGVIDLLNGVSNYATANAAWSAMQDDGGGSTLSLGAAGTIDFLGVTKEKLSAANFKIG